MGLGKTVIGLAAAERLLSSGDIKRCLIVCPASIKFQWAERIGQFTNRKPLVIDGSKSRRLEQYRTAGAYVIIGYDNVTLDAAQVSKLNAGMVVLDEATAIKSFKAQRTKQIKKLLRVPYRLALTGTPIENRPDEVFSIMQWVEPAVLGRYDLFEKAYIRRNKYGWVIAYQNLPILQKRLLPAMSRKSRLDDLVRPFLPEVDADEWYAQPTPELENIYKTVALPMLDEMNQSSLFSDFNMHDYYGGYGDEGSAGKLMGMYTVLEMLLDHPDLVINSAKLYDSDRPEGSKFAYELWQSGALDSVVTSPKLELLEDKVGSILEFPKNKILIFSQYKYMLNLIEDALGIECVKFHGGMSATAKASAVAEFNSRSSCRVFLSSHAGAYGMDMSRANYLINYDLPWSAGKADQINGRHVRASSDFGNVFIRNILTRNTIEERKFRFLGRKRAIAAQALDGDESGDVKLEGDSLRSHLTDVLRSGIL